MKFKTRVKRIKKRISKNFKIAGSRFKRLMILLGVGLLICIAAFFIYKAYLFNNSYDGLGKDETIPANPYDMERFTNDDNGYLSYADGKYDSFLVIDVSVHNGKIDWEKVKDSGVQGAMIRVGYRGWGTAEIVEDKYFQTNIAGAKAQGINVGVYFYSQATTPDEAIEEAEFVMDKIWGRGVNLPVAFDMEPFMGQERFAEHSTEQKTEMADAFLKVVKKFGYEGILYGNPTWLSNDVDMKKLAKYPIWLAHYTSSTDWPYEFRMWQFTSEGRVKGITGDVDLNLYFNKL